MAVVGDQFKAKLSDFGLARGVHEDNYQDAVVCQRPRNQNTRNQEKYARVHQCVIYATGQVADFSLS